MRFLPRMVSDIPEKSNAIVAMQGLNLSDNYRDGALEDSLNMSARRYPYFTTKRPREKVTGYSSCTALFAWNGLVAVMGTKLYYNGTQVGTVTAGAKQFAMIHDKLVIWPDKKYYDMNLNTIKDLGASSSGTGATFTDKKITVTWNVNFTNLFKVNDAVEISGCTTNTGNNKTAKIVSLTNKTITFQDNVFTAGSETGTIKIERKIPDMDFICESGARLWGCSNAASTIYVSSLDDPTNFFDYSGTADDSYAVEVSSEGNFTGCCALGSSVLFFKESTIHKILGSYPAEYSMNTYAMEGVKSGCHKSISTINETIFYMGTHGIYTYSGGTTSFQSMSLGNHGYNNAVGGTDGDNYYLSCDYDGVQYFFTYSVKSGIWIREDDTKVVDFARVGKDEYFVADDGYVYKEDCGSESPDIPWSMTFKPFYETISDGYGSSVLYTKKRYSKITLRTELPLGSWIRIELREDDKPWKEIRKIAGTSNGLSRIVIPIGRCDRFQVRLSGGGQFTLLNMMKEFRIGSDK